MPPSVTPIRHDCQGVRLRRATISKRADLRPALEEMIAHDGPFVLDVQVPYQEHVLPMIPAGRTVDDMITE